MDVRLVPTFNAPKWLPRASQEQSCSRSCHDDWLHNGFTVMLLGGNFQGSSVDHRFPSLSDLSQNRKGHRLDFLDCGDFLCVQGLPSLTKNEI